MLKQKYFLTGIFILSAERQPIKLAWRKIVWLLEPENTPKVIELKEFVEEAISQIVDGITAAQKRVETSGAIVSPRKSNSKNNVEIEGKLYSVQNIEFEVSLANMSGEGGKVGFGVTFGAWGFGSNTKIEGQAKSATNIRFSIPIVFPCIDNKENKKVQVAGRQKITG